MNSDIEHVRVPDEVLVELDRVGKRFPKIASLDREGKIQLRGLSNSEQLALSFMVVVQLVNEIFDNINLVMSDLDALSRDARAFDDNYPLRRFKFLGRTYFYEFGRFEDAFGYYTLFLKNYGQLNKNDRRALMDDFRKQLDCDISARNVFLHADGWMCAKLPPELSLLEAAEQSGLSLNRNGASERWGDHLEPICTKMRTSMYEMCSGMRTQWNMLLSHAAEYFVRDGKLSVLSVPRRGPRHLTRKTRRGS